MKKNIEERVISKLEIVNSRTDRVYTHTSENEFGLKFSYTNSGSILNVIQKYTANSDITSEKIIAALPSSLFGICNVERS